jgi:hypothetical protein
MSRSAILGAIKQKKWASAYKKSKRKYRAIADGPKKEPGSSAGEEVRQQPPND